MKILFHHRIASFDGLAVQITQLVNALREIDSDVVVVGPSIHGRLSSGGAFELIGALAAGLPGVLCKTLETADSVAAFVRLALAWSRHRRDILHQRFNLFEFTGTWLNRITGFRCCWKSTRRYTPAS